MPPAGLRPAPASLHAGLAAVKLTRGDVASPASGTGEDLRRRKVAWQVPGTCARHTFVQDCARVVRITYARRRSLLQSYLHGTGILYCRLIQTPENKPLAF